MASSLALLALYGAAAVAQTATVSLFLPFADPQDLEASIVGVDSTATTYVFNCPDGADPDECGFTAGQTIVQGPETVSYVYGLSGGLAGGYYTEDLACNMEPEKDAITCTISVQQEDREGSGMTSATVVSTTGYSAILQPVTVTAGADKLTASPGATPTGSASTTISVPSNGTATGTRSGSASATGTESDSETTGTASGAASGAASGSATSSGGAAAATKTDSGAGLLAPHSLLFAGLAALAGAILL